MPQIVPKLPPRARRRGARVDLRCASCGYGAVVRIAPERCPMCGGSTWERARPRPLAPAG